MKLKVIAWSAVAVLTAVVTLSALVFFQILPNPFLDLLITPPEHSAHYYPRNTLVYTWLTLNPEKDQREQMIELWDHFNEIPEVEDDIEDWWDRLERQYHLNLEDDVTTWIGPDIAVSLLDIDEEGMPVVAASFSVRHPDKARNFIGKRTGHLEATQDYRFRHEEIEQAETWTDQTQGEAYALVDDTLFVVLAGEPEKPLKGLLELVSGEDDRSLAKDEEFRAAQNQLTNPRFASSFVNIRRLRIL